MIVVRAPCPVCGKDVKPEWFKTGWVIGCAGERHAVQLYRGVSPEEVAEAWDRLFLVTEVPLQ